MKPKKLVSIIIINWNGGEVVRQCLESLARINYTNWELVFVDNGSVDDSENLVSYQLPVTSLKLIKNKENVGFAVANNQGYKKAKGDFILLLNNDTEVSPDFLTKLVHRMEENEDIGIIQPKIYLMDKPDYLDNAGSFLTRIGFLHHWGFMKKDAEEFDKEKEIFSAKGACMLIRREVIEKVGLFDRGFDSYFEETDLCWRAWLSGFKVLFYPKAHIYHKVGYTIRRLNVLNLNFHYYKNRITSQIKNFEAKNIFLILIPHIIISLGIATVFILKFNFSNAFMIFRAVIWNLVNLIQTLEKRAPIQASRVVTDDLILNKLSVPVNWGGFLRDFRRVEEDIKREASS